MRRSLLLICLFLASISSPVFAADIDYNGSDPSQICDPTGAFCVLVNSDGRALVETEGNLSVSPIAGGDRINLFDRSVLISYPKTLVTYTVPALKVVDIESWHLSTDKGLTMAELQIDGVGVDAIRFSTTGSTNRTQASFGSNTPFQAVAGEVIRIQALSGQTGKEFIAGLNGAERDA